MVGRVVIGECLHMVMLERGDSGMLLEASSRLVGPGLVLWLLEGVPISAAIQPTTLLSYLELRGYI